MKVIRYCILAVLMLILAYEVMARITGRVMPNGQAGFFPEPKQWTEVGRKVLLDQSWEMQTPSGWWVEGAEGHPNDFHLSLEGSFASSDAGVRMVVMDKDNWDKWQSGFPPLPFGSAQPGTPFHIQASTAGYYFGFFPQPHTPTGQIPTSSIGIAARLLEMYQDAHPAPIRITAHVEVVVESYCTPAQAEIERRTFAGIRK